MGDISEGVGRNVGLENGTEVILVFPLPSLSENHGPIKWIDSVIRKLFIHSFIHSFSNGLGAVKGIVDRTGSKIHFLTSKTFSLVQEANKCAENFTAV